MSRTTMPGPARDRAALRVVVAVVLLALVSLVALWVLVGARPDDPTLRYERISDSMRRSQVVQILGPPTATQRTVEHLDMSDVVVDTLEWDISGGRERIRVQLVDDKVVSKALERK